MLLSTILDNVILMREAVERMSARLDTLSSDVSDMHADTTWQPK